MQKTLTLEKVTLKPDMSNTDNQPPVSPTNVNSWKYLTGATFKLSKWSQEKNEWDVINDAVIPEQLGSKEAAVEVENLGDGKYKIEETATPEDYDGLIEAIYFQISEEGTFSLCDSEWNDKNADKNVNLIDSKLIVANYPSAPDTVKVQIKKTNGANPLAGAKFDLYGVNPAENPNAVPLYSGESYAESDGTTTGLVKWMKGNEEIGPILSLNMDSTYWIKETKAPDGYMATNENVSIHITNSSGANTREASKEYTVGDKKFVLTPATLGQPELAGDTYVISIVNTPGTVLPNTGGPGTTLYTAVGLGMMLAAAVLVLELKRKGRVRA